MKKQLLLCGALFCALGLSACTSITHRIEASTNKPSSYPAATTTDVSVLKSAANINLIKYKSVETRPNQRSDIAIAVAASGGGYRAANFAAGVMMGMESIKSPYLHGNLLQEVDYFSSVSGGGLAVGYYLSNLYNYWQQYANITNRPVFSFTQLMSAILKSDHGPSLISRNVLALDYTDLLFFGNDRGMRLEENINKTILKTPSGGLVLGDVFVPRASSRHVLLPYWAINTTIYQNSEMYPVAPDTLSTFKIRGYWHKKHYFTMTDNFNNPNYAMQFPASVGVTASASVPFVFPATTLTSQACMKSNCYLQLLDGGLSDNTGVFSAVNFLYQDPAKIKVLIVIDASNATTQPFSQLQTGPSGFPLLWQVFNMTTDALRQHIRTYIKFSVKDILCEGGAKNVVVVYLNLADDQGARSIGTSLHILPNQQQYLIALGEKLIREDPQLRNFLNGLTLNGLNTGMCPAIHVHPELSIPR